MNEQYDISLVTFSQDTQVKKLDNLPVGQKALLAFEAEATVVDRNRMDVYSRKFSKELGELVGNYSMQPKIVNIDQKDRWGLVVQRLR